MLDFTPTEIATQAEEKTDMLELTILITTITHSNTTSKLKIKQQLVTFNSFAPQSFKIDVLRARSNFKEISKIKSPE